MLQLKIPNPCWELNPRPPGYEATSINITIAWIQGGASGVRPPPNRIQFFRFRMCFHRKAPTSEVGAAPQTVNPGSATDYTNLTSESESYSSTKHV